MAGSSLFAVDCDFILAAHAALFRRIVLMPFRLTVVLVVAGRYGPALECLGLSDRQKRGISAAGLRRVFGDHK